MLREGHSELSHLNLGAPKDAFVHPTSKTRLGANQSKCTKETILEDCTRTEPTLPSSGSTGRCIKVNRKRKQGFCAKYSNNREHCSEVERGGRSCHTTTDNLYIPMAEIRRRNQIAVPVKIHSSEPEIASEIPTNSVRLTPARTENRRGTQVRWKDILVNEEDMHFFDIMHPDNVARNLSCTSGRPRLRPVAKITSMTDKVNRPVDAATRKEPWEEFVNMYKTNLAIRNAYSLALHVRTWDIETGYIEDKPEKWDKSIFHWPQVIYQGHRYKFGPVRLLIDETSPSSCPNSKRNNR